jgi:hypothetical protein
LIAPQARRGASGVVLSVFCLLSFSEVAIGTRPAAGKAAVPAAAPPAGAGVDWRPAPRTAWQWQLSGTVDTSVDAQVYDIDLFDTPQETIDALHVQGRKVICNFSAGSYEVRRPDAGSFPRRAVGQSLDPPYASERWLDIRNAAIRPLMEARLDLAASKQCDGVEPDNLDGYENNTGFKLKARHQRAYNRFLADEAHDRGLAVGLKNNAKQVAVLEPSFDFAVVEQCFEFDECKKYEPFVNAGKAVFEVEYDADPAEFCPVAVQRGFSAILKRLDIGAPRVACPTGG